MGGNHDGWYDLFHRIAGVRDDLETRFLITIKPGFFGVMQQLNKRNPANLEVADILQTQGHCFMDL